MDKEGQELEKVEDNRRQASQVIDADIVFFTGLLQFKDGAEEGVFDIVEQLLQGRFFYS